MAGKHIKLFAAFVIAYATTSCMPVNKEAYYESVIVRSIVLPIQEEAQGLPHNTSHKSWNDYWIWRIRTMRKHEDTERYVRMILDTRRKAGLPELRY